MKKIITLLLVMVTFLVVSCTSKITEALDNVKNITLLTLNCATEGTGTTGRQNCTLSSSDNILTVRDNNDNTDDIVLNNSANTMKTGTAAAVAGTVTVNSKVWEFRASGVAATAAATFKATLD